MHDYILQSNVYARANIINEIDSTLLSDPKMKLLLKDVGKDKEPIEF